MEKKDQLTLDQIHYLGQKTEDQLLLKQIKNFNLKTPARRVVWGLFFAIIIITNEIDA